MTITRRDFLNGVALTVVAGTSPMQAMRAQGLSEQQGLYYPPALTGLRGNHPGSFEQAHALGRSGKVFDYKDAPVEETYDLVVVGAGISGLAAAWFYRQAMGEDKKILLIDNHNDFGGHALRNEFTTPSGMVIGYGGSESLQSPEHIYSEVATNLLQEDLGIDIKGLASHFDVDFYPDMGLCAAVFFDKENFGVDKVVTGDPGHGVASDIPKDKKNGRPYREFIADFPIPDADKETLIELHEEKVDYLAGMTQDEKAAYLSTNSYAQFLKDKVKLSDQTIKYFQQQTNDFQAVGIDATACEDARLCGLPGFEAMNLPPMDEEAEAELNDLYIHHFPDGNATIARLLVHRLIPHVADCKDMNDVVLAKFDYSQLDKPDQPTRLRLNSVGVHVENTPDGQTEVSYLYQNDKVRKVKADKVIMAGYNMMIPSIVPGMPQEQKSALRKNVKAPLVYSKVILRNWETFAKLGVHRFYCPTSPYSVVKLDYPVSMGGYEHSKSPQDPICLHMIYVPTMPASGLPPREQSRIGRARLLGTPFSDYEADIRKQLQAMLGPVGFDHQKDILGITVNRWAHGYSYFSSTLWDDEQADEKIIETARQPFGNIHIANSDADWNPYAHAAIDQGWRAVQEILNPQTDQKSQSEQGDMA